ncbi:hypothetical protein KC926_00125 [Candidatus Kaiserbacteria bacterium]|nr:hypothetical protein [Candidatus Kaiserbacteria bacterium]
MKYLSFLALVIILTPTFVFAEYKPLVGIPGVTNVNTDFNSYINALYALSISIAALLAVIKIVIAGVKWMTTDIITTKGEAKKDIQGALLGLLVVLAAVLIITVINPDILKGGLNISKSAPVSHPGTVKTPPPYTIENGDQVTAIPLGMDSNSVKNMCEQVDTDKCNDYWFSKTWDNEISCYKGEYYKPSGGAEVCITRAKDLKLDSFSCIDSGKTEYDNEAGTDNILYNCSTARSACVNAGGKAGDSTKYSKSVSCSY